MEKEFAKGKGIELKFNRVGSKENWYKISSEFWQKQPSTNDGMLEGYGKYHEGESKSSEDVLRQFIG